MTWHLIIILSLSASTVGFALLAGYWRRRAQAAKSFAQDVHGWYVIAYDRQQAALACLTPHSASIGRRMARKLRGEA